MTSRLVVGGGPAGASLALRLARAGCEVTLLERETGPVDKVCGEFLSFEAAAYLEALGVDLRALGAVPVAAVDLVHRGALTTASLPFAALSLSRKVMDEAVLQAAAAAGAKVRRGVRVTGLWREGAKVLASTTEGEVYPADALFLASGKHDVRGWRRPRGPQGDLIGFKQYYVLRASQTKALEGRVELHLFAGGYAGFQPVEGGRANLCLVVRRSAFEALGRDWESLLEALFRASPGLQSRLRGARAERAKPLAVASIPYGLVVREAQGIWRLGDQAAVIPSFAGEGMSIALHSARLAAEAHLAGEAPEAYQRRLAHDVGLQVARATLASRLLVRPWSQPLIAAVMGRLPGGLGLAAAATRIPGRALARVA